MPAYNAGRRWGLGAALVAGLAALGLYIRTLAPTVLVGDSGEFQFTGAILGIPHPTGYPLYTLLGKLWSLLPVGDVAYRINLSSAVYLAAATALLAALVWRLGGLLQSAVDSVQPAERSKEHATRNTQQVITILSCAFVALLVALLFAVGGTVWAQALVARAYALNALLVAGCLGALLLWWETGRRSAFLAAALLVGLSFAHHGTTITLVPGYALLALAAEWRWRARGSWRARLGRWLAGVGMFALGLSPYLLFVYRFVFGYTYYWGNPQSWADVIALARGAPFAGQIFAYPLTWDSQVTHLGVGFEQIAQQFGAVGVWLGGAGLLRLLVDRRTWPVGAALGVLWAGNFVFASNYAIVGALYFIPTYLFWALFMAAALLWPLDLAARLPWRGLRFVLSGTEVLALALSALLIPAGLAALRLPQQDRSGDTQVRDLALQTLAQAAPGARVYVDWESICVLRYYQYVEQRRLDLDLESGNPDAWAGEIGADLAAGRPAYVGGFSGPDPPAAVRQSYVLTRVGLVYQVVGRAAH